MTGNLFDFEPDDLLGKPATAPEPTRRAKPTPAAASGHRSLRHLNRRACALVAVLAVLAAVPVGLNRPVFWMLFAGIVALVLCVYLAWAARLDSQRLPRSLDHKALLCLAAIVPLYALVQSLPLGAFEVPFFAGPYGQGAGAALSLPTISLLPDASQTAALRYVAYILFAILAFEVVGYPQRARRYGWWMFWGIVLHAMWGLLALRLLGDVHFWGTKDGYLGSVTGVFINRNSFATFLSIGICLGLALLLDQTGEPKPRRNRQQPLFSAEMLSMTPVWIGLSIIFVALLGTQSRMGLAAGLVGAAVCLCVGLKKRGVSGFAILGGLVLGLLGSAGVGLALVGGGVLERSVFLENDFFIRFESYLLSLQLIAERPFLGYGFDAFRVAFEQVQDDPMRVTLTWDRAHSTYLTHWVELGLLVGSIPILLVALVFVRLVRNLQSQPTDFALSLAALSALVVGAVHSLVDFSLEMPGIVVLLVALVCFGLARSPQSLTRADSSNASNLGEAPEKEASTHKGAALSSDGKAPEGAR